MNFKRKLINDKSFCFYWHNIFYCHDQKNLRSALSFEEKVLFLFLQPNLTDTGIKPGTICYIIIIPLLR